MSRKMTTFQKILLHLLLIICVGMTIMPVVLVFFSSLKESSTLISTSLIPKFSELSLVNYKRLLTETPFLRWVWNTVVVSALSSVIAIIVTALAGYAFSRFKFFGRKNGLMAMILLQMFPAAMAMVDGVLAGSEKDMVEVLASHLDIPIARRQALIEEVRQGVTSVRSLREE